MGTTRRSCGHTNGHVHRDTAVSGGPLVPRALTLGLRPGYVVFKKSRNAAAVAALGPSPAMPTIWALRARRADRPAMSVGPGAEGSKEGNTPWARVRSSSKVVVG